MKFVIGIFPFGGTSATRRTGVIFEEITSINIYYLGGSDFTLFIQAPSNLEAKPQ
jgi:hypothetical protein